MVNRSVLGYTIGMGLVLVIIGLLIWLLAGYGALGLALIIIGLILMFVPAVPYGWGSWRR